MHIGYKHPLEITWKMMIECIEWQLQVYVAFFIFIIYYHKLVINKILLDL